MKDNTEENTIYEEGEDPMGVEFQRLIEALKSTQFIQDRVAWDGMPIDAVYMIADAIGTFVSEKGWLTKEE